MSAGSIAGVTNRSAVIQGLPSGRQFHYRIVTFNADGTTVGEDQVFRTASTPDITGIRATDLIALVGDAEGHDQPGRVPDGLPLRVRAQRRLRELDPRSRRKHRVGNRAGRSRADDHRPDAGTDLPLPGRRDQRSMGHRGQHRHDLRLRPAFLPERSRPAGDGVLLSAGLPRLRAGLARDRRRRAALPLERGLGPDRRRTGAPLRVGNVAAQQRAGIRGGSCSTACSAPINGLAAPNLLTTDSYLATRTNSGWVTTLPGLTDAYGSPPGKECADDFSFCLEYNKDPFGPGERESEAYLFEAGGRSDRKAALDLESHSRRPTHTRATGEPRATSPTTSSPQPKCRASAKRTPASPSLRKA